MNYSIIDSYSVKEFLKEQGAELIYDSVGTVAITTILLIEVWLKGSSLISLRIDPKSQCLTGVNLYSENLENPLIQFSFYNHKLNEFQAFCNEVLYLDVSSVDSIVVSDWKNLLKIFSVGKDCGSDLENVRALINALQRVDVSYRSKFDSIISELETWIDGVLEKGFPFQAGDLLYKQGCELCRYLGKVDEFGNRLFTNNSSIDCRFEDPKKFDGYEKVNAISLFEETVKGFAAIFDAQFINSVVQTLSPFYEHKLLEGFSVEQICEPFQYLVELKHSIKIEKRGILSGYGFCIDVAPNLVVTGSLDVSMAYISINTQESARTNNSNFSKGKLNPLFVGNDNSNIRIAINRALDFLSSIYQNFSFEIAELGLTDSFIDLYGLWCQLCSEVDCDYGYGETVYQELCQAFAPKELQ